MRKYQWAQILATRDTARCQSIALLKKKETVQHFISNKNNCYSKIRFRSKGKQYDLLLNVVHMLDQISFSTEIFLNAL